MVKDYRSHVSKTITVEFMIIRAPSPYNIILGWQGMMKLRAVASTLHALLEFKTQGGVVVVRGLNKACPKDSYPLPEIDQKIESLEGFKLKCILDAYKGYHQIRMANEDEEKTSFHTEQGIFCYEKMSFELKNAGATYQRLMDNMFTSQLGRNIEIYVDDMVLNGKLAALGRFLANLQKDHYQSPTNNNATVEKVPYAYGKDKMPRWTLFTDGTSSIEGSGAGLILTDPGGREITYALRSTLELPAKKLNTKPSW
uniref:Reverse transcriptase domain-containing protein n=1 Tax=Tanacetum cinerariifolium TaxID=118510 RepID=A0A699HU31_TANCI|nr:reverse transcriptase domain-containing protein [Tanacetum cinerariifolium]